MDRVAISSVLEGGYIESYGIDLRANVVTMQVDVLDKGCLSRYELQFDKVSHISYDTEQSWRGQDYRLQVTELSLVTAPETSGSEEWETTISFWDIAHLTIRCSSILVDGVTLR